MKAKFWEMSENLPNKSKGKNKGTGGNLISSVLHISAGTETNTCSCYYICQVSEAPIHGSSGITKQFMNVVSHIYKKLKRTGYSVHWSFNLFILKTKDFH